jgi:hypothetical protein
MKSQVLNKGTFLLDTAAMLHMVDGNVLLEGERPCRVVVRGLGDKVACAIGVLRMGGLVFRDTLKIKGLGVNMISLGRMQTLGCSVRSSVSGLIVSREGRKVIEAELQGGLYVWKPQKCNGSENEWGLCMNAVRVACKGSEKYARDKSYAESFPGHHRQSKVRRFVCYDKEERACKVWPASRRHWILNREDIFYINGSAGKVYSSSSPDSYLNPGKVSKSNIVILESGPEKGKQQSSPVIPLSTEELPSLNGELYQGMVDEVNVNEGLQIRESSVNEMALVKQNVTREVMTAVMKTRGLRRLQRKGRLEEKGDNERESKGNKEMDFSNELDETVPLTVLQALHSDGNKEEGFTHLSKAYNQLLIDKVSSEDNEADMTTEDLRVMKFQGLVDRLVRPIRENSNLDLTNQI